MRGEEAAELRPDYHEDERERDLAADDEDEFDGQQARLPPGACLGHIVGDVDGLDQRGEAAGAGPDGAQQAEREQRAFMRGNHIFHDPMD